MRAHHSLSWHTDQEGTEWPPEPVILDILNHLPAEPGCDTLAGESVCHAWYDSLLARTADVHLDDIL